MSGVSVSAAWLRGKECTDPPLQNALPLVVIERDLVLRHTRSQIEDSLSFLEKRGYIVKHGYQGLTRVVFQLSDAAIEVLNSGSFSGEEQDAFREALLDVKQPGVWGMKFNLSEAMRRLQKWWS